MRKLKSILLVDDDNATNFLHELVINQMNICEEVFVKKNGLDAFSFIEELDENGKPLPDLILLDINMPVMNGWEFLERCKTIEKRISETTIILMLTTSLNPEDKRRSQGVEMVKDYINKPLSSDTLEDVLSRFFGVEVG